MAEEPDNAYSALIEKSIVTPIKQKFGDFSGQISKLQKDIRSIRIWLFALSVLLLVNILLGVYLLVSRR